MRDGVRLAVDVYLPKGIKKGAKLPTILYQTRYFRSVQLRGPILGKLVRVIPSTPNFDLKEFIHNGYALVCVDVRGTGASFGTRSLSMPDTNEIKDGAEIADWITTQSWSDGKIGSTGVSYIGITAEYLMMNKHPAIKAVAPLFTPFDLYDDVGMPGGIFAEKFIVGWNNVCQKMDQGELPAKRKSFWINMMVSGVGKVGFNGYALRRKAFKEHKQNFYQNTAGDLLEYMDDAVSKNNRFPREVFKSPHLSYKDINTASIPVYSYTGWWDLGFTRGGVRQFMNFTNSANKLTIGPWNHGGVSNISHFSLAKSQYNHIADVMSFFDFHLKGIKTGIDTEPKVKYYTIGEEKWKTSDTWPPKSTAKISFFTGNGGKLSPNTRTQHSPYSLKADTAFGSGKYSRWSLGFFHVPDTFPSLAAWESSTLSFTSSPLNENTEVTGHPAISIKMKSTKPDGAIFAYLLDVDEKGHVFYVSEGHIRLIHHKLYTEPVNYIDAAPYHSFARKDAMPMKPDVAENISFDMFPVSYQFKKGHKIRIAFSTGDKDYFQQITTPDTGYEIESGTEIILPVIKSNL